MNPETIFLSDVHIALEKPEITERFTRFLKERAIKAEAVYILGDLFDVWVGDDDFTPPGNKIREQLKHTTQSGTKIFLQTGNRDFLLGKRFCQDTGVTLLDDLTVIDLYGTNTLLTHGDLLCTDDIAYQAFRVKSHSIQWQQSVLSKPLLLRLLVARWYRVRSFFHKRKKTAQIMDVNQETVQRLMEACNCRRLIHGHTHRPDVHTFEFADKTGQRFVLSPWSNESGTILCWNSNGYKIESV
jgi:UDP-2,3-diacylglucosamine hydrolase